MEKKMDNKSSSNHQKTILIILVALSFVVATAVAKIASSVVIPLIVSILLVCVLYPVCVRLNKIKVPWIVSILIILFVSLSTILGLGGLLITSFRSILEVYPRYEDRFNSIYQQICTTLKLPFDENLSLWSNLWSSLNVRSVVQNMALSLSGSLMSFGKVFMVVFLLMIFLLIELNPKNSVSKIDQAFTDQSTRNKINTVISGTVKDVTRYMSIKFFVSLITGVLVGFCCKIVRLDFFIVWGFLAFILNFIPTFGSIISWGATTIFALLQFYPSFGKVIFIGIAVLAINFIMGNVLEPRWEGKDLGLSPFMILLSLSFFGWLWGFVGMILSVPLMVVLKIIFENTTLLKPIAVLIGNGKQKKSDKED